MRCSLLLGLALRFARYERREEGGKREHASN